MRSSKLPKSSWLQKHGLSWSNGHHQRPAPQRSSTKQGAKVNLASSGSEPFPDRHPFQPASFGSTEVLASAFRCHEGWNEEVLDDYKLRGPTLLINTGATSQIIVVFDGFSKSRRGLAAAAVVIQQGEVRRPIYPCFFPS